MWHKHRRFQGPTSSATRRLGNNTFFFGGGGGGGETAVHSLTLQSITTAIVKHHVLTLASLCSAALRGLQFVAMINQKCNKDLTDFVGRWMCVGSHAVIITCCCFCSHLQRAYHRHQTTTKNNQEQPLSTTTINHHQQYCNSSSGLTACLAPCQSFVSCAGRWKTSFAFAAATNTRRRTKQWLSRPSRPMASCSMCVQQLKNHTPLMLCGSACPMQISACMRVHVRLGLWLATACAPCHCDPSSFLLFPLPLPSPTYPTPHLLLLLLLLLLLPQVGMDVTIQTVNAPQSSQVQFRDRAVEEPIKLLAVKKLKQMCATSNTSHLQRTFNAAHTCVLSVCPHSS